jgi:hypothetical protein
MPIYTINFPEISYPALFLICIAGLAILSGRDGRWIVLALGLQYLGVFLLVFLSWPIELAATKLIAGWISAALLGMGLRSAPLGFQRDEHFSPSSLIFRLLITGFILFAMYSLGAIVQIWFPSVGMEIILGSLFLLGSGILHLGLTTQPFRTIIGGLTFLSGFEVIYAALENAVLVAGLLAILQLSLGFLGVYFMSELVQEESG